MSQHFAASLLLLARLCPILPRTGTRASAQSQAGAICCWALLRRWGDPASDVWFGEFVSTQEPARHCHPNVWLGLKGRTAAGTCRAPLCITKPPRSFASGPVGATDPAALSAVAAGLGLRFAVGQPSRRLTVFSVFSASVSARCSCKLRSCCLSR